MSSTNLPETLLTPEEHQAVSQAGLLYALIAKHVVGTGPTRDADLAELAADIHKIQHRVMAQAAARQYPDSYRLLGEVIS